MDEITRNNYLLLRLRRYGGHTSSVTRAALDHIPMMEARDIDDALASLVSSGCVAVAEPGAFKLTDAGITAADNLCTSVIDALRGDGELLDLFVKLYRAANGDPAAVLDWRTLGEEIGLDFSVIGVLMMRLEKARLLVIVPDDLTATLTDLGACAGERHAGRRTPATTPSYQPLPPAVVDDPEFRAGIRRAAFLSTVSLSLTAGIIAFYFLAPPIAHAWIKARVQIGRAGAQYWLNAVEDALAAYRLNERGTFLLSALSGLEAGINPDNLKTGKYGFTSACELMAGTASSVFPTITLVASRGENRVFEIQKPGSIAFLAAYVDDKTMKKLKAKKEWETMQVILYSESFSSISNPVVFPFKSVTFEKADNITYIGGRYVVALHITCRKFSTRCECH